MKIELVCTGSELLSGSLNTNASYIGSRISAMGLELSLITSVADRKEDLLREFKKSFGRSEIIIITGGLGPTFDDMTVEIVAECLNIEMYFDEKVLRSIEEYFFKKSITFIPKINTRQARVIKGAKVLKNFSGTAPGQMLHFEFKDGSEKCSKILFLLPGPPKEIKPMFEKNVEPFLKSFSFGVRKNTVLRIFGVPESVVEETIKPIMEVARFSDFTTVNFGIFAKNYIVDIKFSVSGTDELVVNKTVGKLKFEICNVFKYNIFGFDNDTLAFVVGKLLTKKKKTISFAESCTGGKIASEITNVAGSSLYFKSSLVAYSNESKIRLLEVKEKTLADFGAVSEETSKEMVMGILKLSGSDYALSVTGIAGPGGATKAKPIGIVYIGFGEKSRMEQQWQQVEVSRFNFIGTREDIRAQIVSTALNLLRRKLIIKHS
ncbi:MAG: competence/damage-inducible protein A [Endomicrobium sp.]|jgi:nicotinamide-nucleotide amidase|nr:competence/damage-inducible protein A [Endomicrobium sp.]